MILQLFGTFAVQGEGRPLPPPRSRKCDWLLALLALRRGEEMDRASLAGLLWPDSPHTQALYNLRRALAELRELLGPEAPRLSSPHPHMLALDLAGAQVDVLTFDAAIARGDEASLESAVELYRGPLLEECVEAWVIQERLPREQAYLAALETLAGHAVARGDHAAAIRRLRQAVAVDPFRETAQQALLKALLASEDTIGALLAYRAFRLRLHQEVKAEPSPETKALFHQLRAQARRRSGGSGGRGDGETARSTERSSAGPSAPRRLPRPLSQFVGRETALHAVEACLESARLVTLTGPGGVGKTRLAIQVADAIADDHVDGVWFVDLARLSEPALVPQAVASVLGVPEQPNRPLAETLAEFLRSKQLLLVLDNCEHLLSASAELVELLVSSSPELRVLATSRQALGLTGEVAWQLPGLSVPPQGRESVGPTLEALLQFEAIRLFVDRGRGATSAFSLTEENAQSVGEICRRLDGIPFAIELAAAWLKALSVAEIAARLDDRFRLLTGGSRTATPRQQTLQATLDWSYDLLSEPERALLRRLAVFAGSFTLEAAEAVCSDPVDGRWLMVDGSGRSGPSTINHQPSTHEVLELLSRLVDRSLVQVVEPGAGMEHGWGETRYRLLETTHEYARLRLAEVGEEIATRERHRGWYLTFAERAEAALHGPEQVVWLHRLEADHDNLRAVLDWSSNTQDMEAALRLAAALAHFWRLRGHYQEGRARLMGLLAQIGDPHGIPDSPQSPSSGSSLSDSGSRFGDRSARFEATRARVLAAAGAFDLAAWECDRSQDCFAASLAIARRLGDREQEVNALLGLGLTTSRTGAVTRAASHYQESLAIAQEIGYTRGRALALNNLGTVASLLGDRGAARRYYEAALALQRSLGDGWGISLAASNLGGVLVEEGEAAAAESCFVESLAIERALGNIAGVFTQLCNLGQAALARGDHTRAHGRFQEFRELARGLGDTPQEASWLLYLGEACLDSGYPATARPFLEESLTIWRERGHRSAPARLLWSLGRAARLTGDPTLARSCGAEALRIYQELEPTVNHENLSLVEDLAVLDAEGAQPERAARLFGAVEALREANALPRLASHRAECERGIAAARAALGEVPFALEWNAGRAMTRDEAIRLALESDSLPGE
jgi:predicted ATPase/DNA-binding SARP family transcriptional activator